MKTYFKNYLISNYWKNNKLRNDFSFGACFKFQNVSISFTTTVSTDVCTQYVRPQNATETSKL